MLPEKRVTIYVISTLVLCVGVICWFFSTVRVPAGLEHRDAFFWSFARSKARCAAATIGEFLGYGSQVTLLGQLGSLSFFRSKMSANYEGVRIRNTEFDGVPVRICEPIGMQKNIPGLIWLHGGGWVSGSAESADQITTELSRKLGVVVISVNYRLAPEFIFPQPFTDCVKATVYLMNHAAQLGLDASRVAIAGNSAGGNLAAAVALRLRDIGQVPRPSIQVLIVPCLQAVNFKTPSYQSNADISSLPRYLMANFWLWYALGSEGHKISNALIENEHTSPAAKSSAALQQVDHTLLAQKYIDASFVPDTVDHGDEIMWKQLEKVFLDPYFAPLMATSLKEMPSSYVVTAEYDVLRDDGIMYVRRLSNDVDCQNLLYIAITRADVIRCLVTSPSSTCQRSF